MANSKKRDKSELLDGVGRLSWSVTHLLSVINSRFTCSRLDK